MEKDDRQHGSAQQVDSSREPQRASRPAPGKVTRTSKLSPSRGAVVQGKAAVRPPGAAAPQASSLWGLTMNPWMDAAHRGMTALAERGPSEPSPQGIARAISSSLDGSVKQQAIPNVTSSSLSLSHGKPFDLHPSGYAGHNPTGACNCSACLAGFGGDKEAPANDGPKTGGEQSSASDDGKAPERASTDGGGPKQAEAKESGGEQAIQSAEQQATQSTEVASRDVPPAQPQTDGPTGAATAPPPPPTITSRTAKAAPGNADRTRTTVGVGEVVNFTGSASGTWTASAGTPAAGPANTTFSWTAPEAPGAATITLTVGGVAVSKTITVVAPTSLSMVVASSHGLTAGKAGVCMLTNVTVGPANVCFGNVEWLEVPGPASGVSGYFTQFNAATLFHNPNPSWLGWNDSNTGLQDHAAWHEVPAPYSAGSFTWSIPNKYRVAGSGSSGNVFTTTTQIFGMEASGRMNVSKAGASASRAP